MIERAVCAKPSWLQVAAEERGHERELLVLVQAVCTGGAVTDVVWLLMVTMADQTVLRHLHPRMRHGRRRVRLEERPVQGNMSTSFASPPPDDV